MAYQNQNGRPKTNNCNCCSPACCPPIIIKTKSQNQQGQIIVFQLPPVNIICEIPPPAKDQNPPREFCIPVVVSEEDGELNVSMDPNSFNPFMSPSNGLPNNNAKCICGYCQPQGQGQAPSCPPACCEPVIIKTKVQNQKGQIVVFQLPPINIVCEIPPPPEGQNPPQLCCIPVIVREDVEDEDSNEQQQQGGGQQNGSFFENFNFSPHQQNNQRPSNNGCCFPNFAPPQQNNKRPSNGSCFPNFYPPQQNKNNNRRC